MYVPDDYEKSFKQADETFLYQLVFDPVSMKLVPLNELPEDLQPGDLEFAGPYPFNKKSNSNGCFLVKSMCGRRGGFMPG